MLQLWRGRRRNVKLITLGSDLGAVDIIYYVNSYSSSTSEEDVRWAICTCVHWTGRLLSSEGKGRGRKTRGRKGLPFTRGRCPAPCTVCLTASHFGSDQFATRLVALKYDFPLVRGFRKRDQFAVDRDRRAAAVSHCGDDEPQLLLVQVCQGPSWVCQTGIGPKKCGVISIL